MTPTLIGRIQTRLFLLATVGVVWTVVVTPALPRGTALPGESTTGELYSVTFGALVLDLTYFDMAFEELILFTFPGGFVNIAEATSEGVELTLDWKISDAYSLRASHTYNDTEDLSTGAALARRPESRTTFGFDFDLGERLRGAVTAISVSDRIGTDGSDMDDYVRFDLALDYRVSERLRPFARLENLFDEDYSEVTGYTSPGFTAIGGLRVDF